MLPMLQSPPHECVQPFRRWTPFKQLNVLPTAVRRLRGALQMCHDTAAVELDATISLPGPIATEVRQQPPPQPAAAPSAVEGLFDWSKAWYPLAAVSALKADAPNAQQLLGMRLVVWWDKSTSSWRCFEDLCPHRLAPLSEGRLHESGQLQCTYHGWCFDSRGKCTSIPQIGDAKAHTTACSSSRSCVNSYPTHVSNGLLWVYADSSSSSSSSNGNGNGNAQQQQQQVASSAAVPPSELLLPEGCEVKSPWFQRDVPLSYDILLENFLDPAHVPHSHHGVVGDRNALHTLAMVPERPASRDGGFAVTVESPARWGTQQYTLEFLPPCLVKHGFPGGLTMLLYGIPTATGHSRVIMSFMGPSSSTLSRPATPQLPAALNLLLDLIDRVPALQHAINRNAIIDGDTYFLHAAERILYERGDHASWRRQYFMPGSSDAAVLAWRKWLDTFGRSLPTLPGSASDLPPLMPRQQVLDRFSQHTQHCPHCSAALRVVTLAAGVMAALAAVAAGSVVSAVVLGNAPLVSGFTGGAAVVAGLAAVAAHALMRCRQLFIFTDYVHAEH